MSGSAIRLFVAVDIPDQVKEIITQAVEETRGKLQGARWVKPGNLHLTLKFIGNYEEDALERLSGVLRKAAQRSQAFQAALGGCGAFPSRKSARVIWIGMAMGGEEAMKIARKLDSRLEKAGVRREDRPFRSHLTLARLKRPQDCSDYLETLNGRLEGIASLPFKIDEMVIYQSILSQQGPTYIPRERVSLGGG